MTTGVVCIAFLLFFKLKKQQLKNIQSINIHSNIHVIHFTNKGGSKKQIFTLSSCRRNNMEKRDRQTSRQTSRQAGRQAVKQTDRQTDRENSNSKALFFKPDCSCVHLNLITSPC